MLNKVGDSYKLKIIISFLVSLHSGLTALGQLQNRHK